jgi:rSAM/selenodomain-associated transferase 2
VRVSVIIPALNEENNIRGAMTSVGTCHEIIVADGGSSDSTREIAASLGAVVLTIPPGRGAQMDSGAEESTGDVLLFLHADSRLPEGWAEEVSRALSDSKSVGGGFSLSLGSADPWLKFVERVANLRSRLGLIYGDQAIFVRRESFFDAGGFDKLPLMEDVDCVKRLRKLGRMVVLEKKVTTSARRWAAGGRLRNTFRNWLTLSLYLAGVGPERLYGMYYKSKERAGRRF